MAISTNVSECHHFNSLEELIPFLSEEKECIYKVSLAPILAKGGHVFDDQSFGVPGTQFQFSEEGFEQFCRHLGTSSWFVQMIQKEELASDILNDRLKTLHECDKLNSSELIIDARREQIIDIVSERYFGYSNFSLLESVANVLGDHKSTQRSFLDPDLDFGNFFIQEAYSCNTRLSLHLLSTHKTGFIKGKGGDGNDLTQTGLQISNSMAGGHALKLSYYLYRLICANGLIIPTESQSSRLVHIGTASSFDSRLKKGIANTVGNLKDTHTLIKRLCGLDFTTFQVAKAGLTDDICKIISGRDLRKEYESWARLQEREKGGDDKERDQTETRDTGKRRYAGRLHRK